MEGLVCLQCDGRIVRIRDVDPFAPSPASDWRCVRCGRVVRLDVRKGFTVIQESTWLSKPTPSKVKYLNPGVDPTDPDGTVQRFAHIEIDEEDNES